jgi:hypothetical protein
VCTAELFDAALFKSPLTPVLAISLTITKLLWVWAMLDIGENISVNQLSASTSLCNVLLELGCTVSGRNELHEAETCVTQGAYEKRNNVERCVRVWC